MSYLKDIRVNYGDTVEEFADVAGMSIGRYLDFENARVDPGSITILEFAKLCRLIPVSVDPMYFFEMIVKDYKNKKYS